MRNVARWRRMFYSLMRRAGVPAVLTTTTASTPNLGTGEQTSVNTDTRIQVLFHDCSAKNVLQSSTLALAATNGINYGVKIEQFDAVAFVVKRPGLLLQKDDRLTVPLDADTATYVIEKITSLPAAWLVALKSSRKARALPVAAGDTIRWTQESLHG